MHVGLAIPRKARRQGALQAGEAARCLGIGPQTVAKVKIVAPQKAALFNQVYVVRSRLAAAKVLAARHASLASMLVPSLYESGNVVADRRIVRPARRHIENRLGAHTGDRRAADMFES